jgi:hypothetical protein
MVGMTATVSRTSDRYPRQSGTRSRLAQAFRLERKVPRRDRRGRLVQCRGAARRPRASDLTAAGFATRVYEGDAGAYITATIQRPGDKDTTVILDEDACLEIRYWTAAAATPAQTTAAITGPLAAITASLTIPRPLRAVTVSVTAHPAS